MGTFKLNSLLETKIEHKQVTIINCDISARL